NRRTLGRAFPHSSNQSHSWFTVSSCCQGELLAVRRRESRRNNSCPDSNPSCCFLAWSIGLDSYCQRSGLK
ncbi:hypothetical protein GOODEAATRI_010316, partial [Goodea atripinnis]